MCESIGLVFWYDATVGMNPMEAGSEMTVLVVLEGREEALCVC